MAEFEQVTVQFRVCSGSKLPKANLLGSIDPYVRFLYDNQIVGETKRLKSQQSPVWEEDFFFNVNRDDDGFLLGVVRLELYNEKANELVGIVEIELSELPLESVDPRGQQQIQFFDYQLSYLSDKRGEKLSRLGPEAHLTVAYLGAIPSFGCLVSQLEGCDEALGLLVCEESQQIYVPLPGGERAGLYGGIQYLLPRAVHFKIVTVSKLHAGLHMEFKCSKARTLTVERHTHHHRRRRILKKLKVYAEVTLTDLPLSTDLRKLQVIVYNRRAVSSCSVAETLEAAGFPASDSALSYKKVAKDMMASAAGGDGLVSLDEQTSAVYVSAGKPPYNTLLQLDFGEGAAGLGRQGGGRAGGSGSANGGSGRRTSFLGGPTVRPALRAVTLRGEEGAAGRAIVYDFLSKSAETTTTRTESHRRAVKILGGEHEVVRASELPGAFDQDNDQLYDTAVLVCYAIESHPIVSFRFTDLFEPPPEEEDEDSDGGIFSVLDPDMSVGTMAYNLAATGGKVVGKMVDGLGNLVGQLGEVVDGVDVQGTTAAAGGAVLKVFKAPLKLFKGQKNTGNTDSEKEQGRAKDRDPEDGRHDSGSNRAKEAAQPRSNRERDRPESARTRGVGSTNGREVHGSARGDGGVSSSGYGSGGSSARDPVGSNNNASRRSNGGGWSSGREANGRERAGGGGAGSARETNGRGQSNSSGRADRGPVGRQRQAAPPKGWSRENDYDEDDEDDDY